MKRKTQKDNTKLTRFILYFFLIAMLFFIYLMSKNFTKSISGNIKSISWVQVDADLLNASIKITQGSTNSSSRTKYTYYAPQVSYKYNFNDTSCIGRKVAWIEGGDDSKLRNLAYGFVYNFEHNIPIKVFINPEQPCESIVDRTIHWSKLTTMGIILIITTLFASGIVYLLVKTSKK
ncbi:DUF3592 domain-containing protein [Neptunomonas phycophila]|uniref:DUF3592 domain-containing protein n=1 Tax=Neptunomonas phycophila TaxID=1572645 RepID=UPI000948B33C|nr:DUF3592 domain-containing protein [Neptunomonas phycophila]